jgi:hypothetical protein
VAPWQLQQIEVFEEQVEVVDLLKKNFVVVIVADTK